MTQFSFEFFSFVFIYKSSNFFFNNTSECQWIRLSEVKSGELFSMSIRLLNYSLVIHDIFYFSKFTRHTVYRHCINVLTQLSFEQKHWLLRDLNLTHHNSIRYSYKNYATFKRYNSKTLLFNERYFNFRVCTVFVHAYDFL